MTENNVPVFKHGITEEDLVDVYEIAGSSGFFSKDETMLVDEVAREAIQKGELMSGYSFIFCTIDGRKAGFACYGLIPCTDERYRIYWLAVDNRLRRGGVGTSLIKEVEKTIVSKGGKRVYLETSMRPQYQPTNDFYRKCGYIAEAKLENFYFDGDGMVVYVKIL
ncbi:GCN5-related N-acetyltransferase [Denitrovibrio acetiphilus DSM 12809]|uniref:GCN5-related N-acetyltransferase n=1 Tax=Denitrovibrio acetiphilus (strain DSM 12809 / NBRC 114555 / N2460) TaxID=522772 RepID=D4H5G5_DENA2|nr:GNAT family N-acetyltransferase [Denitrovibrio acetiphilus]ADD67585.1 GCN5-related N-acetyltransferase [Denitrovibrio acetiphilus DSM 12809]